MNKLFVVATTKELKLLENYNIDNSDRIVVTGIGPANIIASLNNVDRNIPIINVGYCGSNTIPVGTIVSIVKSGLYHPNFDYLSNAERTHSQIAPDIRKVAVKDRVHCLTSVDFVTSCKYKLPFVFDMELAFISMLGFNDVRADKYVSDNLSVSQYEESIK